MATFDGKELPAQRVDGWKQGWVSPPVPPAPSPQLPPRPTFGWALGLGAVGVALVLLSSWCALVDVVARADVGRARRCPRWTGRTAWDCSTWRGAVTVPALLAGWYGVIAAGARRSWSRPLLRRVGSRAGRCWPGWPSGRGDGDGRGTG